MALWTLDTCGVPMHLACQVTTDQNGIAIDHVRVCENHAKLGWDHTVVEAENHRKNVSIAALCDAKGVVSDAVAWAIDPATRVLSLSHPDVTKADVATAIAVADQTKSLPEVALPADK